MEKIAVENGLLAAPVNRNKPMTRLEMTSIMLRIDKNVLGNYTTYTLADENSVNKKFIDFKSIPKWGKGSAVLAVKNRLTNGISSNKLGMNLKMTREMAALSIQNLLDRQEYYNKIKNVGNETLLENGIAPGDAKLVFARLDSGNGEIPTTYIFYGLLDESQKPLKGVYARDLDYDLGMTYTDDAKSLWMFK